MDKKIHHTHENELTHSMVHYLLTIHKLKEVNGYARVTDIAKDLNLTKGSVSTAVNNLKKRSLIQENESKFLNLSDKGHEEVHKILSSRTLLFYFLKDFIGVSEEYAHKDSCLMEHLLSNETRTGLFGFMKKILEGKAGEFSSNINLAKYSSIDEFLEDQKGDTYLK